jgi:hypothetical protein
MAYLSEYQYYENAGAAPTNANWGSYQFLSLTKDKSLNHGILRWFKFKSF